MSQWRRVPSFAEVEADFFERAHRVVWCNVATVDGRGRPISRILHPIWEHPAEDGAGPTGWIATRPSSPKARDLRHNPFVSLAYVADVATPLYVECEARWANTLAERQYLWNLFAGAEPPLGFDPAPFFGSVEGPDFGVLRLTPWRIQLHDTDGTRRTWLR